ncbi:uncharacterized protein si:dkey-30c15.13 [Cheilinus undulatus]|uniref:uncharacterized protein si:dkey-30c15.13 n=1 Tax=Cheilinus undulatus TaxID=241271 RepID=UPI001BD68382|nr:uncharacterized protein si:dkey-30c15.13 [Cheilinus undulatus]
MMTQNMFQEGLHQVFFKDRHSDAPTVSAQVSTEDEDLYNVRIHRWFGTVVNARVLVAGVVQILGAFACMLFTVSHTCMSYNCSISMTTPVWSSIAFVAAGCLTVEVQRRANQLKVITLMGLNIFSMLFGFSAILANSVASIEPVPLNTKEQQAGSHIANGGSLAFTVVCLFASVYILFLSWSGLRRYSPTYVQAYRTVSQIQDETNGPLLEQGEHNL